MCGGYFLGGMCLIALRVLVIQLGKGRKRRIKAKQD